MLVSPGFRGPATAAIRRVPYPDIPNELWLLLDGPTISLRHAGATIVRQMPHRLLADVYLTRLPA